MAARRIILALVLILAPALAWAQSLTGNYLAYGRDPNGAAYSGTVAITDDGSSVNITWYVGAQVINGSGTRQGAVVTITWNDPYPVIYVVLANGELHGTWANGTAHERLIPR